MAEGIAIGTAVVETGSVAIIAIRGTAAASTAGLGVLVVKEAAPSRTPADGRSPGHTRCLPLPGDNQA